MCRLINLGLSVGVTTASSQHHSFIMEANVAHQSKPVIGDGLFKSPKKIVCRRHQKRTVLYRVFFIPSQRRMIILLRQTIESLNKSFDTGGKGSKIKGRSKHQTICIQNFRHNFREGILDDTRFTIPASVTAHTSLYFLLKQGDSFHFLSRLFCPLGKCFRQLRCISPGSPSSQNHEYLFHTNLLTKAVLPVFLPGGDIFLACDPPSG